MPPESNEDKYGSLWPIVRRASQLMAASAAITLAWRGRAAWEPSEQDIALGPQKVAALVTAVLIAVLYGTMSRPAFRRKLVRIALRLAGGCVAALLVYGFLVGMQTYDRKYSPAPNEMANEKIIGGFWLTDQAVASQKKYDKTVQELLAGAGYDPDRIWSRASRSSAKACFVASYISLIVCGSIALVAAAITLTPPPKK